MQFTRGAGPAAHRAAHFTGLCQLQAAGANLLSAGGQNHPSQIKTTAAMFRKGSGTSSGTQEPSP